MKNKFAVFTMGLLMVLTMATGAFAQRTATFSVSHGVEARGRSHGHAELTGGITLFRQAGAIAAANPIASAGTVAINYGTTITNGIGATSDDIVVNICGEPGVARTTTGGVTAGNVSISKSKLTVYIFECTGPNDVDEAIDVSGVRVSLAGSGHDSLNANITVSGGVRLLAGSVLEVPVIQSIGDELTDDGVDVDDKVTLIRHTGKPEKDAPTMFKLVLEENTVSSFNGTEIDLEFFGIPDDEDVSIKVDAWVASKDDFDAGDVDVTAYDATDNPQNNQVSINTPGQMEATLDAETTEVTVLVSEARFADTDNNDTIDEDDDVTGGILSSGTDVVIIRGWILGLDDDEKLPLENLNIQVTADVGPIGKMLAETPTPRFSSDPTTPMTVIESSSAQTKMTLAFALARGTYDTGISVANTGKLTGPIMFTFYHQNGTESEYMTTGGSAGTGLNTGGMLEPKGTYVVLLSELLSGDFTGYLTITTDFTGAKGTSYISDFAGFAAAGSIN